MGFIAAAMGTRGPGRASPIRGTTLDGAVAGDGPYPGGLQLPRIEPKGKERILTQRTATSASAATVPSRCATSSELPPGPAPPDQAGHYNPERP